MSIDFIKWLINVTNNNDGRWKPEISPLLLRVLYTYKYNSYNNNGK